MTTKRFLIALLVAFVVLVVVYIVNSREQQIAGRPLSYWTQAVYKFSDKAAFQVIRTNCPVAFSGLTRMLRDRDWAYRDRLARRLRSHPRLKAFIMSGRSAEESHAEALVTAIRLGPDARPLLPDVIPLMTNQSRLVKYLAFDAVRAMKPDRNASSELERAIMDALQDPEKGIRRAAAGIFLSFQPQSPADTRLVGEFAEDPDENLSGPAQDYLVARTNVIVLPALIHDLKRSSYMAAKGAAQIPRFGTNAMIALPALERACTNEILPVRQAATNAISAILGRRPAPTKREGADITLSFPDAPIDAAIKLYEQFSGQHITPPRYGWPAILVKFKTEAPLTKAETLELIEQVLLIQGKIVLVHEPDGSLIARNLLRP